MNNEEKYFKKNCNLKKKNHDGIRTRSLGSDHRYCTSFYSIITSNNI